jgi:hypothetical protein
VAALRPCRYRKASNCLSCLGSSDQAQAGCHAGVRTYFREVRTPRQTLLASLERTMLGPTAIAILAPVGDGACPSQAERSMIRPSRPPRSARWRVRATMARWQAIRPGASMLARLTLER